MNERCARMETGSINGTLLQVGAAAPQEAGDTFANPDGEPLAIAATTATPNFGEASKAGTSLQARQVTIGAATVTAVAMNPARLTVQLQLVGTVEASREACGHARQGALAGPVRINATRSADVVGARMEAAPSRAHVRPLGDALGCGPIDIAKDCSLDALAQAANGIPGQYAAVGAGLHSTHSVTLARTSMGWSAMRGRINLPEGSALSHASFLAVQGACTQRGQGTADGFEGARVAASAWREAHGPCSWCGVTVHRPDDGRSGTAALRRPGCCCGRLQRWWQRGCVHVRLLSAPAVLAAGPAWTCGASSAAAPAKAAVNEDLWGSRSTCLTLCMVAPGAGGYVLALKADFAPVRSASEDEAHVRDVEAPVRRAGSRHQVLQSRCPVQRDCDAWPAD